MSDLEQFSKIFSLSVFIFCLILTVVGLFVDDILRNFKSKKRRKERKSN